jgi:hypothetical protein
MDWVLAYSALVTDPAPASRVEMALMTFWSPVADPPTEVVLTLETIEARWLTVDCTLTKVAEIAFPAENELLRVFEMAFRMD